MINNISIKSLKNVKEESQEFNKINIFTPKMRTKNNDKHSYKNKANEIKRQQF